MECLQLLLDLRATATGSVAGDRGGRGMEMGSVQTPSSHFHPLLSLPFLHPLILALGCFPGHLSNPGSQSI